MRTLRCNKTKTVVDQFQYPETEGVAVADTFFLRPALCPISNFNCLISKSLKDSFLQVFIFRCQVVAEGCSGGLLSGLKERCELSLYLGKLIYNLLVD